MMLLHWNNHCKQNKNCTKLFRHGFTTRTQSKSCMFYIPCLKPRQKTKVQRRDNIILAATSKLIHYRRLSSSSSQLHPHWRRIHYNILKPDTISNLPYDHSSPWEASSSYVHQSFVGLFRFTLLSRFDPLPSTWVLAYHLQRNRVQGSLGWWDRLDCPLLSCDCHGCF